jgi:hypothetical protein
MTTCRIPESVGEVNSANFSFALLVSILVLTSLVLLGCQLVPSKPDAVFLFYRDHMKTEKVAEARALLSDESRALAVGLESQYKLDQPPEILALLSVLDPTANPAIMQSEDTLALLQVRTLRGGLRIIRMVRADPSSSWKFDMTGELKGLKAFLDARAALELMKDQAGEYAASWKAFNEQMQRINPVEADPPPKPVATKPPVNKQLQKKTIKHRPVKPKPKKENAN